MANGTMQLPGMTINAAQMRNDPMAQMLEAEYQAGLAAAQQQGNPQARAQGLLSAQAFPGEQPQMSGFGAPGGEDQIRQIYGLLAQYGDDPSQAGQGFVSALQRQQQLNRQNQPIEQFLRLYGNVNPYDFETDSLQSFHNNFVKTGQLDFGMLKRREGLSTKEQGFLNDAITTAQKAEADIGRMSDLSNRFDEMARQGIAQGRLAGGFNEWAKGMLGGEDQVSQLRTEYEQLRISSVVQNLPPGVASDKDVELVLRGWPSGVADPAYIASFLRGMQKLRAIDHAAATHSASYLSRNRTQQGQLEDWNKNAEWLAMDALRRHGGYYNPGDDISAEDAARMRYNQMYGGGAPQPGPGSAMDGANQMRRPPPPAGSDVNQVIDYYLNN